MTTTPPLIDLFTAFRRSTAFARRGDVIEFWGSGLEALYGIRSEDAVGRSASSLLQTHRLDAPAAEQRVAADGYWRGRLERTSRDGTRRLIDSQWIRLPAEGDGPTGVIEIDTDVTAIFEHREFESRLIEQAEALWRSNRELEQFAWACSHDLREPLRRISNFADLLEVKHRASLSGEARHYLDSILASADRMAVLVGSLSTYANFDAGPGLREPLEVAKIARAAFVSAAAAVGAEASLDLGTLPTVKANALQIRQLFRELAENAFKFRDAGRPLCVAMAGDRHKGMVRLSVADNGIGVEREYRDQVFRVFRRLNPDLRYKGTGVGLAICRKIVEGHGGRIWLESEPGKGSTFFFTLPAPSDEEMLKTDAS